MSLSRMSCVLCALFAVCCLSGLLFATTQVPIMKITKIKGNRLAHLLQIASRLSICWPCRYVYVCLSLWPPFVLNLMNALPPFRRKCKCYTRDIRSLVVSVGFCFEIKFQSISFCLRRSSNLGPGPGPKWMSTLFRLLGIG